MFTVPAFRQLFPEFTDLGVYPDLVVTAYATLALARLDPCRWDSLLDYGTSLYVAHYLALGRQRVSAARKGKVPGLSTGPASSKSVGPVSVSFDLSLTTIQGAGQWNQTSYGIELYQLMGQMGAGGVQVDSRSNGSGEGFGDGYFPN
jgi:hypothetical protein